ncbi:cytochrome c3 family protein [Phaeovulum sp.]|uniref:cytochrome c3 family protein n=1 Tax=Phaeovulum sp. TaxID=2934796 RepID=UPI00272FA4AA|nr:cytochrome c3 family protein [Phaeovulum sp.]MDP1667847.1 cytochrome c3 family protein [Phaeovulum sp.]MDZ4120424.1 cytochrome c3 family protein [Phaeovulum sp.]
MIDLNDALWQAREACSMGLRATSILVVVLGAAFPGMSAQAQDPHTNAGVPLVACHEFDPSAPVPNATCVACHGTMLEPIEGASAPLPDPHRSPHLGPGEVPVCAECHSIHGKSEVTCVICHQGFKFNVM